MNQITPATQAAAPAVTATEIMEQVIVKGDLSKLTPEERSHYYMRVCQSVGLNPLTKPFEYITLNGKLTLYARRDAADQLRSVNDISLEIVERSVQDDLMVVHVRAKNGKGRIDEDMGIVNIGGLKGEAKANAMLKAITKAKRRVTLSISGLGFLDETEVEDIPEAAKARPPTAPKPIPAPVQPPVNPETGTVSPHNILVPLSSNDKPDWIVWGSTMLAAIKTAKSRDEFEEWLKINHAPIRTMEQDAPKIAGRLSSAINVVKTALGWAP